MATKLFTIGHSHHEIEKFIGLLRNNAIEVLVDVRTSPYSRYNPQFNKESLERTLADANIRYIYEGKDLGGRPSDPSCYKSQRLPEQGADYLHEVNYKEVMERPWFQGGIQRLLQIAKTQTTAILCSEEDPAQCHRHHLIAKYLMSKYPQVEVYHIRGDGNIHYAKQIRSSVDKPEEGQLKLLYGYKGEGDSRTRSHGGDSKRTSKRPQLEAIHPTPDCLQGKVFADFAPQTY
jgi:uncharacterized protein (DUF488 family)